MQLHLINYKSMCILTRIVNRSKANRNILRISTINKYLIVHFLAHIQLNCQNSFTHRVEKKVYN